MNFNKYVTILKEKLSNSIGFPLSDILTETIIQQALKDEQMKYRERLYTPMITLVCVGAFQSLTKAIIVTTGA